MNTQELVEQTLQQVVDHVLNDSLVNEHKKLPTLYKYGRKLSINSLLNKIGLHITTPDRCYNTNKMFTTASAVFMHYATLYPQVLDQLWGTLVDDDSRYVLEWFIKYHVAFCAYPPAANELYHPNVHILSPKSAVLSVEVVNENYKYKDIVYAQPGDIVLDIGGYVGDTAIWFSNLVGDTGHVFVFEPEPHNWQILTRNIRNYKNITAINKACSAQTTQTVISNNGIINTLFGSNIDAVSIDDLVENGTIPRVDFIKMDIEGSELLALQGAISTIRTWRPKLAICVYHKGEDLFTIPQFITSLVPEYKLYLKHCSNNMNDTILFAKY